MAIELAERRSLTLAHARMWLRHVGFDDELDTIDGDREIIADARAVLADGTRRIASDVRGSLEFYRTQAPVDLDLERVVLTGAAVAIAQHSLLSSTCRSSNATSTPPQTSPSRPNLPA